MSTGKHSVSKRAGVALLITVAALADGSHGPAAAHRVIYQVQPARDGEPAALLRVAPELAETLQATAPGASGIEREHLVVRLDPAKLTTAMGD